MQDIDKLIAEALDSEERALMAQIAEEPNYFHQAMAVFQGRMGWVSLVLMLVQGTLFIVGAWMAYRFFAAADMLEALRWGLPSVTFLLMSLVLKMTLFPVIHIRRLEAQLKRLELQVVRARRDQA